jgi:ketosteroid isomerase-like protein
MTESQRASVRAAVERGMASFEAAERALDPIALVGHFSAGGGFYMHNDGVRLTRDDIVAGVSQAFPTLRSLEGGFTHLEIHVLAPDAALATAVFEETITTHDGTLVRQRGAATWLWREHGGQWKIAYGHVDHQPNP